MSNRTFILNDMLAHLHCNISFILTKVSIKSAFKIKDSELTVFFLLPLQVNTFVAFKICSLGRYKEENIFVCYNEHLSCVWDHQL